MSKKEDVLLRKNIILHSNIECKEIKSSLLYHVISYDKKYKDDESDIYTDLLYKQSISSNIWIFYLIMLDHVDLKKSIEAIYEYIYACGELYGFSPIKIAIIKEGLHNFFQVSHKYSWINTIDTLVFNNKKDAMEWLMTNLEFDLQYSIYTQLFLEDNPFVPLEGSSIFIQGFFRNAMMEKNTYKSIMLFFDYLEFLLLNLYYYGKKYNKEDVANTKIMSYEDLGKEIIRLFSSKNLYVKRESYYSSSEWKKVCRQLKKYFSLDITGDTFNFLGLIMILQQVRNCTKGHGVIVGKSAEVLRTFLIYLTIQICLSFELFYFFYTVVDTKVFAFYHSFEDIDLSPYVFVIDGHPLILYENGKRKEYIDYFSGNYIISEIK